MYHPWWCASCYTDVILGHLFTLGCTLVQTGPHRSIPDALNARPGTTLNSGRSLTAGDGHGNLCNFLNNKHLLRILLTVCLPLGIQYFDLISNRVSLTPLWYTFSCALSTTKSVKWWELGISISSFVSNGNFPLFNRPLHLKYPSSCT